MLCEQINIKRALVNIILLIKGSLQQKIHFKGKDINGKECIQEERLDKPCILVQICSNADET